MNDIGLIGLGVMGGALARNFEKNGFKVALHNRTSEKTDEFLQKHPGKFEGFRDLKDFVVSLQKPRKIVLMISAGAPVDETLAQLEPLLNQDDIILDGGNSFYKDTERREKELAEKGILLLGTGISGGAKGAYEGPSIMLGGSGKAWKTSQSFLEKIAARDFSGNPCVSYLGEGGAGHYVKMVHNGIEYGILQLIAETYQFADDPAVFEKWNEGKLNSYLIEITGKILQKRDLLDKILDVTEQKGTGQWTSMEALQQGIPVSTIVEATFARFISAKKDLRKSLAKKHEKIKIDPEVLEDALYAAEILTYQQGFSMLENFNQQEIVRIWQGGCIIRARLLTDFSDKLPSVENLRKVVMTAVEAGLPIPAFSSTLQYFDSLTTDPLPMNLIQALRDYFGAHGFRRTDKPGTFHGDW